MDPIAEGNKAARAKRRQQRLSTIQNPLVDALQPGTLGPELFPMVSAPRVLPALVVEEPVGEDVFDAPTQESLPSAVEDPAQSARRRRRESNMRTPSQGLPPAATVFDGGQQPGLVPPHPTHPLLAAAAPAQPPPAPYPQPQLGTTMPFFVAEEDVVDGPPPGDLLFTRTLRLRDDIASIPRPPGPRVMEEGLHQRVHSPEPQIKMALSHDRTPSTFQESLEHWTSFFFNVSHGVLAGIAVCQLLVSRELDDNDDLFITLYSRVALSLAALFLPLLTVCVVSVYVRLHGGWSDRSRRLAWLVSAAIVYGAALIFTLIMADTDVQLEFASTPPWSVSRLSAWRVLNVLRFVGCLLGWFLLVIDEHVAGR